MIFLVRMQLVRICILHVAGCIKCVRYLIYESVSWCKRVWHTDFERKQETEMEREKNERERKSIWGFWPMVVRKVSKHATSRDQSANWSWFLLILPLVHSTIVTHIYIVYLVNDNGRLCHFLLFFIHYYYFFFFIFQLRLSHFSYVYTAAEHRDYIY